jgi:hypothetical protein
LDQLDLVAGESIATYRAEMPGDEEPILDPSNTCSKFRSITRARFSSISASYPARYKRNADSDTRRSEDDEDRADVERKVVHSSVIYAAVVRARHGRKVMKMKA